jgi:hypothetical protein
VLQNKKDSLKKLCISSNDSIKTFSDNAKKDILCSLSCVYHLKIRNFAPEF